MLLAIALLCLSVVAGLAGLHVAAAIIGAAWWKECAAEVAQELKEEE